MTEDEKKRFQTKTQETGTPEGYKLRRIWVRTSHSIRYVPCTGLISIFGQTINNGVRDELEYYTCK